MNIIKKLTVKFIGIEKKATYVTYEEFTSCPYFLWGLDIGEIRLLDNKDQTVIFDNKDDLDEYLERMARKADQGVSGGLNCPCIKVNIGENKKLELEAIKLLVPILVDAGINEVVKIPQLKEEVLKLSQENEKLMSYTKTLEAYSETLEAHNSNLEEENTKLKAKLANIAEITK